MYVGVACGCGITWGTHLGDTKLVASMTLNPVSDNLFMSSTLVSVETIVYINQRFQLISGCGPKLVAFSRNTML